MATIKELIPLSTDILSGEAITNAQAKFLANTSTAGTIAGVTEGECVTADSSGNVTGFNNVGVGAKLTSVNIDFSGIITGTGGSASITGVTLDTITLDGPTINTSISGSAIDTDLTTSGGTTTTIPHGSAVVAYVTAKTVDNSDWSGTELAVNNGGTGRSSHIANQVIVGGTSTTNPQASITGGTSGYVLTSTGTTSKPSWQSAPGGATQSALISRAMTANGYSVIAHTLGTYPDFISSWLQCTTNDGDYVVGDRIYFGGSMFSKNADYGTSSFSSITINASSSFLYLSYEKANLFQNTLVAATKLSGSSFLLDTDDWTIYARAYRF